MPADGAGRPTTAERAQTAAAIVRLQHGTGAFRWDASSPPGLAATSTALRVLAECSASVPRLSACLEYITACFEPGTGGFAPTPGGTVDLNHTVQGHVALATLDRPGPPGTDGLLALLDSLVRTGDDVWTAAAFLNYLRLRAPSARRWAHIAEAGRNIDGLWGDGAVRVTMTATRTAGLLFLRAPLSNKQAVTRLLLAAQTPSGGWPDPAGQPTLQASYYAVRALRLLGAEPDSATATAFVASCRQTDGSYTPSPDAAYHPADASYPGLIHAYFALTVDRWINDLEAPGIR